MLVAIVSWFMPKDFFGIAKLRAETCPRAEIRAYLRARATTREIVVHEPWNYHRQYAHQFSDKMVGTNYEVSIFSV